MVITLTKAAAGKWDTLFKDNLSKRAVPPPPPPKKGKQIELNKPEVRH